MPRSLSNTASAKWKREHKDHVRKKLADWLAKNQKRRKAYMDAYHASRKEIQRAYDAERYLRPENVAKRKAKREQKREYMRQWIKDNRGRLRSAHAKRQALKRGNAVGNTEVIAKWMAGWRAKSKVRCYWCKKWLHPKSCHADHIEPLAAGGGHLIENLCIACGPCNRAKHTRQIQFWNRFLTEPVLL